VKLYFLRHAIATERDTEVYPDDGLRPLTEAGYEKMAKIARALCKMDIQIDQILTSPLLRARETAEIVRKNLHIKKDRLVLIDQLAPSGDTSQLIADIKAKYLLDSLLLVGHEPDLSKLISLLLSGDPSLPITMKKGGLCCLSVDELKPGKCATLEWLINPAQLEIT
jgi:phosphohistidine phosphatase